MNSRFSVVQKAAWKEAVGPLLAEDEEERQYLAERMYKKNNASVASDKQD